MQRGTDVIPGGLPGAQARRGQGGRGGQRSPCKMFLNNDLSYSYHGVEIDEDSGPKT